MRRGLRGLVGGLGGLGVGCRCSGRGGERVTRVVEGRFRACLRRLGACEGGVW
jgi:hypothetical protein